MKADSTDSIMFCVRLHTTTFDVSSFVFVSELGCCWRGFGFGFYIGLCIIRYYCREKVKSLSMLTVIYNENAEMHRRLVAARKYK